MYGLRLRGPVQFCKYLVVFYFKVDKVLIFDYAKCGLGIRIGMQVEFWKIK